MGVPFDLKENKQSSKLSTLSLFPNSPSAAQLGMGVRGVQATILEQVGICHPDPEFCGCDWLRLATWALTRSGVTPTVMPPKLGAHEPRSSPTAFGCTLG